MTVRFAAPTSNWLTLTSRKGERAASMYDNVRQRQAHPRKSGENLQSLSQRFNTKIVYLTTRQSPARQVYLLLNSIQLVISAAAFETQFTYELDKSK